MKGKTMQPTKDFPAPTDEAAYWACIGFRHDFGLLPDADAQRVRAEGLAWLAAWRTGFADGHESAGADGLGDDWDEPFANTIDAACLTFDPGFRTRPFHEASAIRRGGIKWLQAWRKAVEDQGLKNRTPSAGLADPIERGLKAVDGALQIVGELQAMIDHPQRPVIREADEEPDPRVAALVRCAEAGVPTDVQALLVQGDPMRGICPDIVGLILGLGPRRRINWRDDPGAIVEDDEPQIGRDYA